MATALSWVLWDVASPGWEGSVKNSQSPAVLQGFISFPQMNLLSWNLNYFEGNEAWFALKIEEGIANTMCITVFSFMA